MENGKILITGSEGYIGSVLMPMLINEGYDVVGLDTCYYSEGNLNNTQFPLYPLINKDIRDIKESDFINKLEPKLVERYALPKGEIIYFCEKE